MTDHDVIVLGGGPGGYCAAERLAHGGKKVLLIEKDTLGGTCLNVGCIPTKSLLHSAKLYDHARHGDAFGVTAGDVGYDWSRMQAWKAETVGTLVRGVTATQRRLGVTVVKDEGRLAGPGVVEAGGTRHHAEHVVLATGSVPVMPPIPGAAESGVVVDSTGLLAVSQVPARLVVIGGGVIGIEFASLFAMLGSEVTVVEMTDEILPTVERDLAAMLRAALPSVTFHLGSRVESVEDDTVVFAGPDGGTRRLAGDAVLMAAGRRPLVDGWGAREVGLDVSPAGVVVDDLMRTNLPNVWAVGDVTGRSQLAHAAYRMAEVASAHILDPAAARRGQRVRWDTIPWAVYSNPELAGVGRTGDEARRRGHEVVSTTVPLALSGRFVAENGVRAPGAVTLVADAGTRAVLGIHLLGNGSPEMIWGAAAVLESELTVDDLRQVVFPHPTVAEGIREAAWAVPD